MQTDPDRLGYPLSTIQAGMLYHGLQDERSGVDIEQIVANLSEPLVVPEFKRAWEQVVQRHAILRTCFVWEDVGAPRQVVHDTVSLPFREEDWRGQSPSEMEINQRELLRADRQAGFDFAHAPLMRLTLVRLGEAEYRLLWTFHHALLDGRSFPILLKEVFQSYEARKDGLEVAIPEPYPFQNYIEWLQQQDFEQSRDNWKKLLQGFSTPTPFGVDCDLGQRSSRPLEYHEQSTTLSADETTSLRGFAEQHGVTMNTMVQAAWALLLSRYSGEEDIVFGGTRACRATTIPEAQAMVGIFINTLPIRIFVDPESHLIQWLQVLRSQWMALRAHEHTPLTRIQAWSDMRAGSPLFESIVVFENFLLNSLLRAQGGAWVNRTFTYHGQTNFPITVMGYLDNELQLVIGYYQPRFTDDTIKRMLGHLRTLLMGMTRRPDTRLRELPILTDPENKQLVEEWNQLVKVPAEMCIHELVAAQVQLRPGDIAIVCEQEKLTYRELDEQSNQLANYLRARGVGPESLVALCLERSTNLVVAILGVLKAGGAYLPLDLAYPTDRLAFMLEDAQACVLLTQKSLQEKVPRRSGLRLVCLDSDWQEISECSATVSDSGVRPHNLAYVIYTSGSTGKPKGVMVTHANVVRLFGATDAWFGFNERDVWTFFHSYAFDFSVWEIWGALIYGGRLVVVPYLTSRSPEAFYELLRAEGVTVLNQTPSAFNQLIQVEEAANIAPNLTLRYVIFGGEALELQSLRPWFERHGDRQPQLVNMYGITETTVHVTYRSIGLADLEGASGSVIGVPIPDLELYVLDRYLNPVPIGVPGEIYVGGEGVARGYLKRDQLTAERFILHPFHTVKGARLYKTGDLGRFLPGRDLEYLGRADDQVKVRGFRIELGEIESVLCQHPRVRNAVVIARSEISGTKRLVAYLVLEQDIKLSVTELRVFLQHQLPDYMVPSAFVILMQLPLTPNGKVDRKALPEPEPDRPLLGTRYLGPRNAVEAQLSRIWSEVLRLEQVGVQDNFFEIGGDSIISIQIVARARRAGLRMKPQHLFRYPTIAELASVAEVTEDHPSVQEIVAGEVPLTPIQKWFLEMDLEELQHYNQSFLFEVTADLERSILENALKEVNRQHDALRLRFIRESKGWRQFHSSSEAPVSLCWNDLAQLQEPELKRRIETLAAFEQGSLDLENGPLWRVAYFDLGPERPGRLLFLIHHLAVDGISWRPLLEDLETAYQQLKAGRRVQLPAKTTAFKVWAERLQEFAKRESLRNELAYWKTVTDPQRVAEAGMPIAKQEAVTENTEGSASTYEVSLGDEETRALIQKVPVAYNTQINDVLLTALARTWSRCTGSDVLSTNLEGHGRENLYDDLDLSRTVGWFTSIFPVQLELSETGSSWNPGEALKSVKEQLRQIPQRGVGYGILRYLTPDADLVSRPEAPMVFNYLGQFEQVLAGSKMFRMAHESSGPWHSPKQRRRYLLEINSLVIDGSLKLWWTYNRRFHSESAVRQLADEFKVALRELILHCQSPNVGGRTPSDFPLAGLEQSALDRLVGNGRDAEDIYPLSPIQRLFFSASPGAAQTAFDQWHCTLRGELNVAAFKEAWRETLRRHSILRSTIHSEGFPEPVQVVHRHVPLPWTTEDWRSLPVDQHAAHWSGYLKQDRAIPLTLTEPPLMRFALVRLDQQTWKFLWSIPALLLDGWSWPLVFRDVSQLYEAFSRNKSPQLETVRPYRDYLEWLRKQSSGEAQEFWREALAGFKEPTPIQGPAPDQDADGDRYLENLIRLSTENTSALQVAARRLQITLNTLVQGAWALLLNRQSGRKEVLFGSAFSGRPTDLRGVESIVGPFVNNLPIRVAVDKEATTDEFLRQLHRRLLVLSSFQFTPLIDIQRCSEVPWRHRLFDSLIVFQNYLVDESARQFGGQVEIADFNGPIHTNFPLMLLAEPGAQLRLTLIYDRQVVARKTVERWGHDLVTLLERMPASLEKPVAEMQELLSPPFAAERKEKLRLGSQSQNYVPPQTSMERTIAALWQKMFDLERVGIDENFFDLGGHSLLLVEMHRLVREELKTDFPIVTLFEHPTVRSLASHLGQPVGTAAKVGDELRDRAERQKQALARMRGRLK
jgi:amino acid adenylation domain-containing protein/non-ribosomal peptide synthase protein (TIGR01720 family)